MTVPKARPERRGDLAPNVIQPPSLDELDLRHAAAQVEHAKGQSEVRPTCCQVRSRSTSSASRTCRTAHETLPEVKKGFISTRAGASMSFRSTGENRLVEAGEHVSKAGCQQGGSRLA